MEKLCINSWYKWEDKVFARIEIDNNAVYLEGDPNGVKEVIYLLRKEAKTIIEV